MYIGFDYGTANCAVAIMEKQTPRLLNLEGQQPYISSTICAPTREAISEALFRHHGLTPDNEVAKQLLRSSIQFNKDEGIEVNTDDILFGQAALDHYLRDPEESYFVKSPKSFLGTSGLHERQVCFFEDLVCAMMLNIKQQAERQLQTTISDTVIGRPINFQGVDGEKANQQAIQILQRAAQRAGFNNISFQYEPVAAGIEYESTLQINQNVLVVDIGGGTTDCSMLRMGPQHRNASSREQDLLAHSGCRVGGNDLDIGIAFQQIMPEFGKNSLTTTGLSMPVCQFWDPIAINNVVAQADFYAYKNHKALTELHRNARVPQQLQRLLNVYQARLGHQLVRHAELLKIALSNQEQASTQIMLLEEQLEIACDKETFSRAIAANAEKISQLIDDAVNQAGTKPDSIFITGGSARSPILRQLIESRLPGIELIGGDYFGSVTAGLARCAQQRYG
ncbi:molecular chaperone [Thaumasiovibrio sp. DFM-14]|uniref:molecular chaperone n=1 Tax=Thaumasiovibrio sp. DFM-14 TaxID=3384792 RepID=UPI0039A394CF